MHCRIFKALKSATQSGLQGKKMWVLEMVTSPEFSIDITTGWTSSADTLKQLRLTFDDKDSAITYAQKHQLHYFVEEEEKSKARRRSYSENFTNRQRF